jgi:adenine-specific DNA-methyltransferase
MKKFEPDETRSADILTENIERLKTLFPEAVTEGNIDFEVLKQLLGSMVDEREEKYGLNWHGKRRARQLALTPSTGTLRPCPEDSVDWDTTQNIVIEGDNLEVLKLLQKSYAGKVKIIDIDPPYNTGKDFVYPDDFHDNIKNYLELTGQVDGGKKISSNTETSGRFHTDWLNMMYPRMKLERNLLRDDGAIFVTIDDNEVHNLRMLLNEVFGEENFVAQVEWQKRYTRSNNTDDFTSVIDHICIYQKSDAFKVNLLARDEAADARFTNPDNDPRGPWKATPFLNQVAPERRPNLCYPITNPQTGKISNPDKKAWRYEKSVFEKLLAENRLYWGKEGTRDVPDIKTFLSEVREGMTPINFWSHQYAAHTDQANREIKELFGEKIFDTPKPVLLVQRMLEHGTQGNDIVLDFFAGTGTTGHAVMAQNAKDGKSRRFIVVQLPEPLDPDDSGQKVAADFCDKLGKPRTIAEITKERLRRAGKKIREENPMFAGDIGFRVFKLDTTNIRAWEPDRENLSQTLLDSVEHLKTDRSESDVLYELLLKLGLDLCVHMEQKTIAGKAVHSIGAGTLVVCLAPQISREEVEPLALGIVTWHKALAPAGESTVVFRDGAFADDVAKTNLAAILQQHGLENVRSL